MIFQADRKPRYKTSCYRTLGLHTLKTPQKHTPVSLESKLSPMWAKSPRGSGGNYASGQDPVSVAAEPHHRHWQQPWDARAPQGPNLLLFQLPISPFATAQKKKKKLPAANLPRSPDAQDFQEAEGKGHSAPAVLQENSPWKAGARW